MNKLITHTGVVAPIALDNVDTDQIIPSREMKKVSKTGLGVGLFAGWRYTYDGVKKTGDNPDFVLNQPSFTDATIILSKRNFGCGSSREHAVWALRDYGIRVVIAESFGRIFATNCTRNRLLTVPLPAQAIEHLFELVAAQPGMALTIDLQSCQIKQGDNVLYEFAIEAFDRNMLLEGLDHIDVANRQVQHIDEHIRRDKLSRPWAHL